jgi:hypothetical protein
VEGDHRRCGQVHQSVVGHVEEDGDQLLCGSRM